MAAHHLLHYVHLDSLLAAELARDPDETTPRADQIRAAMDRPWYAMTSEERQSACWAAHLHQEPK